MLRFISTKAFNSGSELSELTYCINMSAGNESRVVLVTGCSKGGIGFALYAS